MSMRKVRGFTLVELLVVIAIITMLLASAMVGFGQIQRRGRDDRRMQDIHTIAKALAIYDVGVGAFPVATSPTVLTGSDAVSLALTNSNSIPVMPREPNPSFAYTYQSNAAGNSFVLTFCLETDTIPGYVPGCTNTITP
jgi:prepilin-type N-terminal cleavage/methylation domain-containing protein